MKFDELGLSPEILTAVTSMGFTELTPIQKQTYELIRQGHDLMALAETGSGKTSACGIPLADMDMLSHILYDKTIDWGTIS